MTRTTDRWAAVCWDFDGTLVDTEGYWQQAEFSLAARYGGTWSADHAMAIVGFDLMDSAHYIREHMGIDLEAAAIVDEMNRYVRASLGRHVRWRAGAMDFLMRLKKQRVPLALVTMSYRDLVDEVLSRLPAGTFDVVVTGDIVERGKPDPAPYLMAADLLGVTPSRCLAIEDSGTGAASASAAGCEVLVVPHLVEVPGGLGRRSVPTLEGAELDAIAALFAHSDGRRSTKGQ
ncbi:MAG: HAD family hydrolase [Nocardioides sp.]